MFCIACGTKLPDNAKFCPECGIAITYGSLAETVPSIEIKRETVMIDDSEQPTIDLPAIDDPSVTVRIPKVDPESGEVLQESTGQQKNYVQSSAVPQGWTPQKVALLVALIAVALALFFFASQLLLQNYAYTGPAVEKASEESSQKNPASTAATSSEALAAAPDAKKQAEVLDGIYSEINIAYANVADYNSQIDEIVTDFNSLYLASSMPTRQEAANRCTKLMAKITTAQADLARALAAAGCTKDSLYFSEAQQVDSLFTLLNGRVGTIGEAWKIDLTYENPSAHESEILAPIAKADEAGRSKYLSEFEKTYPAAKPKKLH
ncbi:MAG: zinc ribbon domain-containing protein [Raoultibacter sp.]